jgi:clan AA aspartic protease
MMTGTVNAFLEAIIHLMVRGPQGQARQIEAVIDTGYSGMFSLPPALIAALGLPFRRRGRAVLADGSVCVFHVVEAIVIWDGQPRRIPVDTADADPLIGMGLLDGYELTMQVMNGGSVTIRALP